MRRSMFYLTLVSVLLICSSCKENFSKSKYIERMIEKDRLIQSKFSSLIVDSLIVYDSKGLECNLCNCSDDGEIVIRYSPYSCSECVDFVVQETIKEMDSRHISFLLSDVPLRDLHVWENDDRFKGMKFYCTQRKIVLDFDDGITRNVIGMAGFIFNWKNAIGYLQSTNGAGH